MAASIYTVKGSLNWAKVFEINRDKTGPNDSWEETGGRTSINVVLDKENFSIFKASGSRLKPDMNDDGTYTVQFTRKWKDAYENYGGQPVVVKIDGSPWSLNDDGLIGNGSVGLVKFTVYDTQIGKGTRLEGVQVLEHVSYASDYTPPTLFEDMTHAGEGTKQKSKPSTKDSSVIDDEIPF